MKLIEENKLKPIFTSRKILYKEDCVNFVSYDEEGDWLCFHTEKIKENEVLIISVEQILILSENLKLLPNMSLGDRVKFIKENQIWEKY